MKAPDELEREAKRAESEHAIFLRVLACGHPGCRDTAPRWQRCKRCRKLVARCPLHDGQFTTQVAEHCA